ncbi:MAG TPA: selenide, water dikinase SelD [Flavobacteriales bacterium]|jgi:selenide,water dikinase|nr:selenide, water dikinase SelD [Flavobacteriales bacterium]
MALPDPPTGPLRLTQYSHGAGCGCKIAPAELEVILRSALGTLPDPKLLVGYGSRDDAAVYDIGGGRALISTTDFFSPIVDDAFDFGRIAATNALSDVYAMGGRPLLAVAILGWPIEKLGAEAAQQVVEGGRRACHDAGIALAGGHSIDAPEPFFGLAVTGEVAVDRIKRNDTAKPGDVLFLTKPIGTGILSTAQKRGRLRPEHAHIARDLMCRLNAVGAQLGAIDGVHALTDVTGFGLGGHLLELCKGSGVSALVEFDQVPIAEAVSTYIAEGCYPDGAFRNWRSYGSRISGAASMERMLVLSDPQTSGGLLIACAPEAMEEVGITLQAYGDLVRRIGMVRATVPGAAEVEVA